MGLDKEQGKEKRNEYGNEQGKEKRNEQGNENEFITLLNRVKNRVMNRV